MSISLVNRSTSSLAVTSATVVPYNASRSLLLIQNPNTSYKVAFSFTGDAVVNGAGSVTLNPGETVEWRGPLTPDNVITAVSEHASATGLTIYEG